VPRAGLNRAAVVEAALATIDDAGPDGFEALTLAAVASRVGVAVPSLYKHVGSLADLRTHVAVASTDALTRSVASAAIGRSGADALEALADAVRDFARAHPARYLAAQFAPALGATVGSPLEASATSAIEVIAGVLRGFRIPEDRAVDAIRLVRSCIHGFVVLELGGGFGLPDSLEQSFALVKQTLVAGVERFAVGGTGSGQPRARREPRPRPVPLSDLGSGANIPEL
jgi:AcrR family transcriptional regulator